MSLKNLHNKKTSLLKTKMKKIPKLQILLKK